MSSPDITDREQRSPRLVTLTPYASYVYRSNQARFRAEFGFPPLPGTVQAGPTQSVLLANTPDATAPEATASMANAPEATEATDSSVTGYLVTDSPATNVPATQSPDARAAYPKAAGVSLLMAPVTLIMVAFMLGGQRLAGAWKTARLLFSPTLVPIVLTFITIILWEDTFGRYPIHPDRPLGRCQILRMVLSPVLSGILSAVLIPFSAHPSALTQAECLCCTLVVALNPDLWLPRGASRSPPPASTSWLGSLLVSLCPLF